MKIRLSFKKQLQILKISYRKKLIVQAAKLLGAGVATVGLTGAGIGIGTVFGCAYCWYFSKFLLWNKKCSDSYIGLPD